MPYDEALAERVREVLGPREDLREQKMFGGLAFMVGGHMCCGIHGDELIARVDPDWGAEAVEQEDVRLFDLTGRPMSGFLMVGPGALASDAQLEAWVARTLAFVATLPAKR